MRFVHVGDRQVEHDERAWSELDRQRVQEPPKMYLLGRLPCEAEANVQGLYRALSGHVGEQDRAVGPAAGQDGEGAIVGQGSPRYTQPDVHVSRTTISDRSGSEGTSRSQIHRARTSLVGFSSPSISLR